MIEPLETRIAPATLNLSGTLLGYSAASGITNSLTIDLASGIYTFTDTAETITLNAAAIAAGFTGSGTNAVSGPATALASIRIQLGNGNDTLNLNGLADPISVLDDAGTDTVNVATGSDIVDGNVSIEAETVIVNSLDGVFRLAIAADTLGINGSVGVSTSVAIETLTVGRAINLGSEGGNSLNITAMEFARFSEPQKITIGRSNSGTITISAALNFTNTSVLALRTGNLIADSGVSAGITVESLAIDAAMGAVLNNTALDVDFLAASASGTGAALTIVDDDGFQIDALEGLNGIDAANVTLFSGPITQAAGAPIVATNLALLGTGPFALTNPSNDVAAISGATSESISFVDANALVVGLTSGGQASLRQMGRSTSLRWVAI